MQSKRLMPNLILITPDCSYAIHRNFGGMGWGMIEFAFLHPFDYA